jgi:hypothetical protein
MRVSDDMMSASLHQKADPDPVGYRFFAVFPTILSRLMFFNYVNTASLMSAILLH